MILLAAAVLAAVTTASPLNIQSAPQKPPGPAPQGGIGPRDAAPNAKGTAILRGRVLNTEGRPLRRVQIRIGGELIPEGRTASTNGLGKWEVRDLPAGRFTLSATRSGYLNLQYGQKRYGEPGRPIELG